jgi:Uma2 family endonuclease
MKVGLPARKLDRRYTYGDYCTWPDDERWELIRGVAWNMSPAPSVPHQRVVYDLFGLIRDFLKEHPGPCQALGSPVDVFFPDRQDQPEDDVDTVVQPDIVVVCDPAKVRRNGVHGSPDWVIEVLSPHTSPKDMREKLEVYETGGVKEYWIVDPGNLAVHVYELSDGRYGEAAIREEPDVVPGATLRGFNIPLRDLFRAAWEGMA